MIRLKIVAEGSTEEVFARDVLGPHLARFGVFTTAFRLTTAAGGRRPDKAAKGGIVKYSRVQRDLRRLLREDRDRRAFLTTMFDFYALPRDFPGWDEAQAVPDPRQKVDLLQAAMWSDLDRDDRFIPYLQLHEFETLILVEPSTLRTDFPAAKKEIEQLVASIEGLEPEFINEDAKTAPSKRIIARIEAYGLRKREVGPRAAGRIGLPKLRERCPHFGSWLERLEALGST